MKSLRLALLPVTLLALAACEPEVGSAEWCQAMEKKGKSAWTAQEAKDFTDYCVLGKKPG